MIILSTDSWHYKFYYKWFNSEPPKTLCPYFWIMFVLMIISPMLFLVDKIPSSWLQSENKELNYEKKMEKFNKQKKSMLFWDKVGDYFLWVTQYIIFPIVVSFFIYSIYFAINQITKNELLIILWILIGFLTGFGILTFLVFKLPHLISNYNLFKSNFFVILKEISKSYYIKACPIIRWKNKN